MHIHQTQHASLRAQQRGIPPLITAWLLDYGEEYFDGHGAVVRFFSRSSVRRMRRDFGDSPIQRLSEFLRCYLVQSNADGAIITIGKRHRGRRLPSR